MYYNIDNQFTHIAKIDTQLLNNKELTMLKKSLAIVAVTTLLSACSTGVTNYSTKPSATFKISDIDTQKWIEEGNKAEQCLFPKQWKKNTFKDLSDEEKYLHLIYVYRNPLINIIGQNNFQIIDASPESQQYIYQQYLKFNHSNKTKFETNWCNNLKSKYKHDLAQIKQNIKQQKAQIAMQKKAEIAHQKQEEKERKAREAYLKTPAGQAELARQQQIAYQQHMLAQQRAYQEQMLQMQRQAAQQAEFQQFSNSINSASQNMTNAIQHRTQMINNATQNMRSSCQSIGQGWGTGAWQNVCY